MGPGSFEVRHSTDLIVITVLLGKMVGLRGPYTCSLITVDPSTGHHACIFSAPVELDLDITLVTSVSDSVTD